MKRTFVPGMSPSPDRAGYQAPLCGVVVLTPEAAVLGGSEVSGTTKDISYESL